MSQSKYTYPNYTHSYQIPKCKEQQIPTICPVCVLTINRRAILFWLSLHGAGAEFGTLYKLMTGEREKGGKEGRSEGCWGVHKAMQASRLPGRLRASISHSHTISKEETHNCIPSPPIWEVADTKSSVLPGEKTLTAWILSPFNSSTGCFTDALTHIKHNWSLSFSQLLKLTLSGIPVLS